MPAAEFTRCAIPFCPCLKRGEYGWWICSNHWPVVTTVNKKRVRAAGRLWERNRSDANARIYQYAFQIAVLDCIMAEAFGTVPTRKRKKR